MHGTPRHAAVPVLRPSRARGGCVACAGGPAGRLLRRRAGAYGTGRALASTGPGIASLCLLAAASCRVHLDDG